MQPPSQDLDLPMASIGLAALVGIGLVWWLSGAVGLDMATSAGVLWRLLVLAIITGALFYFGQTMAIVHPARCWPLLLAAAWACWWPALDFYASQAFTSPDGLGRPWWDSGSTKACSLVVIAGAGLGLQTALRRRG